MLVKILVPIIALLSVLQILGILAVMGAIRQLEDTLQRIVRRPDVMCPRCQFPMKEGDHHSMVGCEVHVNGKSIVIQEVNTC